MDLEGVLEIRVQGLGFRLLGEFEGRRRQCKERYTLSPRTHSLPELCVEGLS